MKRGRSQSLCFKMSPHNKGIGNGHNTLGIKRLSESQFSDAIKLLGRVRQDSGLSTGVGEQTVPHSEIPTGGKNRKEGKGKKNKKQQQQKKWYNVVALPLIY